MKQIFVINMIVLGTIMFGCSKEPRTRNCHHIQYDMAKLDYLVVFVSKFGTKNDTWGTLIFEDAHKRAFSVHYDECPSFFQMFYQGYNPDKGFEFTKCLTF